MKLLKHWGIRALLVGLLASNHVRAQQEKLVPSVLLDEDFRSNEADWTQGPGTAITYALDTTAGTYTLRRPGSGSVAATRGYPINQAQDFSIEMEVRGSGGLVWGRKGGEYSSFCLRPDAQPRVLVVAYRNGQAQSLASGPLPAPADWHSLRVARRGNELRYELDGAVVHQQPWQEPAGRSLGFMVGSPTGECTVRRLRVQHLARPIRLAPNLPATLRREHLGPPLSDPARSDQAPLISADGQWLAFRRVMSPTSTYNEKVADKDVYFAQRRPDGSWGPAQAAGPPINNAGSNAVLWLSADGQEVLLLNRYKPDGSPGGGAGQSRSRRQPNGTWSVPELAVARKSEFAGQRVNYCFDVGNTLQVFSKQLDAGSPDADLFMQFRQADGTYGEARSLGAVLNLPDSKEMSPFLAPDGTTLYFASNGHPGYGKHDVFVTRRLDDTWTNWSEPLNLGPAVNTRGGDAFFSVAAAGDFAYYSSQGPTGNQDLYRIALPPALAPRPTRLVRGRVLDARTGQPIATATVRYERLPEGQEAGSAVPTAGEARFEIILPTGSAYGFRASAEGYLSVNENVDLTNLKQYGEVTQDLLLLPLLPPTEALPSMAVALNSTAAAAVPATVPPVATAAPPAAKEDRIVLNNVFFVQGKPVLLPSSFPELGRLAQTLGETPGLRIRLDGHTDNTGDAKDPQPNQLLSEQRVAAVKAYLVKRGVTENRLQTQGFGGSRPAAPNDTEENKRKNRRVEFVIVSR